LKKNIFQVFKMGIFYYEYFENENLPDFYSMISIIRYIGVFDNIYFEKKKFKSL
jgi:hypothetical protein